jgi:sorbitol/mannitol transport system substrate-binding protein
LLKHLPRRLNGKKNNQTQRTVLCAAFLMPMGVAAQAETVTIATVNDGDMLRMQKLARHFTDANPGIELEWVTLEENLLRQRVTPHVATKGGQRDVMTTGAYEVPIWSKQGRLLPLQFDAAYDVGDPLPAIAGGLSMDGKLFAAPFCGQSSMVMDRIGLMEKAGLTMPQALTWDFIVKAAKAAKAKTDAGNQIHGICLRGKAGWGGNMAFLTAMSNSFGAKRFDMDWNPSSTAPSGNPPSPPI